MGYTCTDWWQFVTSAIGVFVGSLMFIVLFIVCGNYAAGLWAFFTGVFAAVCFHITYLHAYDVIDNWHDVESLKGITLLGVLVSLLGTAGFTWHIFAAVYYHIPLLPLSDSAYIASVWAAMNVKFGLQMICFSIRYIDEIRRESPPLLHL